MPRANDMSLAQSTEALVQLQSSKMTKFCAGQAVKQLSAAVRLVGNISLGIKPAASSPNEVMTNVPQLAIQTTIHIFAPT